MKSKNEYGLLTCIAMIIGIVIGSGIFFKSDDILIATNGNILLGVLAFCIAAISIIFGSLTVAQLAARTNKAGGVISYAEDAYNGGIACAFGWFQTFLYFPTLIAIVCYVVGIYVCLLFNLTATPELKTLIGFIAATILFIMNLLSNKLAGYFQTASTFIKLIPLILIGSIGFIFGNPSSIMETKEVASTSSSWLSALIPIVFAFDGWIVSTSISHEVKNAKRNIPLALICAPLAILFIYLLYFVGISTYLGAQTVMLQGDGHVELIATRLLGDWASKGILVFIIISVAGTANGLMMGLCRLPYSLSIRGMFPFSKQVKKLHPSLNISVLSYGIAFIITLFWMGINFIDSKYEILPGSDISEISITLNYLLFILLYVYVFKLGVQGEIKGFIRGKLCPILATLGSLIILYVGLMNPLFIFYVLLCVLLMGIAYLFWFYHKA